MTEKNKGRDPTRAPKLGLKPRPELPPSLRCHHHLESGLPTLETRAERGAAGPTHHRRSQRLPLHRHPSSPGRHGGSRDCRPVRGRRLTPAHSGVHAHHSAHQPCCGDGGPSTGSKLQGALCSSASSISRSVRTDGSQDAQGDRVIRKMDSSVALQPHAPGKHQWEERLCSQESRAY